TAMAGLVVHDVPAARRQWMWDFGLDPSFAAEDASWVPRNPFLLGGAQFLRTGLVTKSEDMIPEREVLRTEYFNDFLKPRVGVLSHLGAVISWERDLSALLVIARRIGKPPYRSEHVHLVRILMPHLQRAILINRQLVDVQLERAAAAEALDRLPTGVVVLDDHGKVILLNRAAEAILRKGDGLLLGRDGLAAL